MASSSGDGGCGSQPSLVSRARTALHSAAVKAERVITDIKADLRIDRESDGSGMKATRRPSERELTEEEVEKSREEGVVDAIPSQNLNNPDLDNFSNSSKLDLPQSSVVKRLATAVGMAKSFNSLEELRSCGDSLSREKAGLSLSAVKSLILRDKDEKTSSEFSKDEEIQALVSSLFEPEECFNRMKNGCYSEALCTNSSSVDLRGAPLGSFVHQLSEIIGSVNSLHSMALCWHYTVLGLKKVWSEGSFVPRTPSDGEPDLNSCLLHQKIQVINCCIARKRRRKSAKESLDAVLQQASSHNSNIIDSTHMKSADSKRYARTTDGFYVLRRGVDHPCEKLTMLETGEPVYSPVLQEGPVLTEDLIKEAEEFVLRTGSVGAGCSQLLSDMQAFKAANPGCILEDFIRWHSPLDWEEAEAATVGDEDRSLKEGRLSGRMRKKGNLWWELWETAKPLPAVEQVPLFDEDLAVEHIFDDLEDIKPTLLFGQLLSTLLAIGLLAAEAALPTDSNLSKIFADCKAYIVANFNYDMLKEKLDDICKVYETIEMLLLRPSEAVAFLEQSNGKPVELKGRFKKIGLSIIGRDRQPPWKRAAPRDDKQPDEKGLPNFSNLVDNVFSRRKSRPGLQDSAATEPEPFDDTEWTVL